MRWTAPRLVSGVQSLYGALSRPSEPQSNCVLEDIKQAMLDEVKLCAGRHRSPLAMRITEAMDSQDLWYLRGDVMAAIAEIEGEASARRKLNEVSNMFKGLLPKGLSSRPSPLSN